MTPSRPTIRTARAVNHAPAPLAVRAEAAAAVVRQRGFHGPTQTATADVAVFGGREAGGVAVFDRCEADRTAGHGVPTAAKWAAKTNCLQWRNSVINLQTGEFLTSTEAFGRQRHVGGKSRGETPRRRTENQTLAMESQGDYFQNWGSIDLRSRSRPLCVASRLRGPARGCEPRGKPNVCNRKIRQLIFKLGDFFFHRSQSLIFNFSNAVLRRKRSWSTRPLNRSWPNTSTPTTPISTPTRCVIFRPGESRARKPASPPLLATAANERPVRPPDRVEN